MSYPSSRPHHSDASPLCSKCANIEYGRLFRRGQPEYTGAIRENQDDRVSQELASHSFVYMGKAGAIRSCRLDCALCRVVADALDRSQDADSDLCFAQCRPFCAQRLRTTRRVADGWSGRMGIYTWPADVALPEGVWAWTRAPVLLELQHCSSPVPTVYDPVPTHRYKFSHDMYAQLLAGPPAIHQDPRLGGRLLDANSVVSFRLLRSWIKTCEQADEETCGLVPAAAKYGVMKGIMFIDVEMDCVVDSPGECQFVALSYCWGSKPTLKHLTANSAALRARGGLNNEQVPLTIRDAMLVTREIGYRYLWVDAFCIVQDDPVSAQEQIKQMDQIYSNAHLTIIAAAGEDSSAGLPGIRAGSRNVQQDILRLPCGSMITVIDGPPDYGQLRDSRWATRAWTMQERILSRRKLIFTPTQVFWECQEGIFLEEMVLEGAVSQQFIIDPTSSTRVKPEVELNLDRLSRSALRPNYAALVQAYTRREMTNRSDAINAFAGLLSAMGRASFTASGREEAVGMVGTRMSIGRAEHSLSLTNGEADPPFDFWGLPVDIFNKALSWEWESSSRHGVNRTVYDFVGAPHTMSFPSWSWASWVADAGSQSNLEWFEDICALKLVMPEIDFYSEGINNELKSIEEAQHDLISIGQFYVGGGHRRRDRWKRFGGGRLAGTGIPDPGFISNGRLRFNTSVATLRIYRLDRYNNAGSPGLDACVLDVGPRDNEHQFKGIARISLNNLTALDWAGACEDSISWPTKRVVEVPRRFNTALEDFRRHTAGMSFMQDMLSIADPNPPLFDWNTVSPDIEVPGLRYIAEADFIVIGRSVNDPKQYLRTLVVTWSEGVAYRIGCAWIQEDDWGDLSNREWKTVVLG